MKKILSVTLTLLLLLPLGVISSFAYEEASVSTIVQQTNSAIMMTAKVPSFFYSIGEEAKSFCVLPFVGKKTMP